MSTSRSQVAHTRIGEKANSQSLSCIAMSWAWIPVLPSRCCGSVKGLS